MKLPEGKRSETPRSRSCQCPGQCPGAETDELYHVRADEDRAKDECGVFGIYAEGEDVARLTYFGLFSLQHRGQESAGIAVTDGRQMWVHKRMGLVTQVFDETVLRELAGHAAIGHTRYSTT